MSVRATALKEHETLSNWTGCHLLSCLGLYWDNLGLGEWGTDTRELFCQNRVPLSEKLFEHPNLSAETRRSKRVGLLESKKLTYKHVTNKTIYHKSVT